MRHIGALLVACALSACGGSSNCDFKNWPSGTFAEHFDEEAGGSCGALPDINVLVDAGQQSAPPECTITNQLSNEAECTGDIDVTCDDAATGVRVRQVAHLDYDSDGNSATGTDTIAASYISTGAAICTSTYKIKFTRQ